jgi:hypothetical protein
MPDRFESKVIRMPSPDGTLFVTVMENDQGKPCEIHLQIGKSGSALRAWTHATSELLTVALQSGATMEEIITRISGVTSDRMVYNRTTPVRSGPDALIKALMVYKGHKYDELNATLGSYTTDRRRRPASWNSDYTEMAG